MDNTNSGNVQELLVLLGGILGAQEDNWKKLSEDIKELKEYCSRENNKDQIIKTLETQLKDARSQLVQSQTKMDELKTNYGQALEKMEKTHLKAYDELKEAYEKGQVALKSVYESEVNKLKEESDVLESRLSQQEKAYKECEEKFQQDKAMAETKLNAMQAELGSSFPKFRDLYQRFKHSPWTEDIAMQRLYGENYAVFFALCGNEGIVRQFYENLQSVVLNMEDGYLEMADQLLDFCVAACAMVNKATYSRHEAQAGERYNYWDYMQCGKGGGENVSRVILRGVMKDGQVILGSLVEVEREA